ncbi:multiheme c-type cytochrome [Armatimonas rosea]|uniref:Cytochrome c-552/4 domain-containing protein n=1 Tax=Armatimonas rosea TaxID=685828 RepID=A0A7W9W7E7_ARMRO|nr:multiheme c-type cytochrome [Armatimonas rosea]MBB6052384.1 hypothetical protein [Armatimonas rosea]
MRAGARLGALALPLLLLAFAACTPSAPEPGGEAGGKGWGTEPSVAATASGFVGNDACKPCHETEFASHAHTRHMQTLREGTQAALGPLAPPAGPIPGAGGEVTWDQGQLTVIVPNKDTGAPVPVPIDLVLGSGKTGMTCLAVHDQGSVELRKSYFPPEKKWFFTPGMERYEKNVVAASLSAPETVKCIACHAVSPPDAPLLPERRFFGVGCESCHGPGGAHATAMQKGDKSKGLLLTALRGVGGKKVSAVCGKCHQTLESITQDNLSKTATNRFQPYGLSLSKCFQKSDDKLSCVTCHNPHEDASTDTKQYEAVCVSCHAAPKKACPVNPKEKCVSCHMPTRSAFANAEFSVSMADHFIRVFRK